MKKNIFNNLKTKIWDDSGKIYEGEGDSKKIKKELQEFFKFKI